MTQELALQKEVRDFRLPAPLLNSQKWKLFTIHKKSFAQTSSSLSISVGAAKLEVRENSLRRNP